MGQGLLTKVSEYRSMHERPWITKPTSAKLMIESKESHIK